MARSVAEGGDFDGAIARGFCGVTAAGLLAARPVTDLPCAGLAFGAGFAGAPFFATDREPAAFVGAAFVGAAFFGATFFESGFFTADFLGAAFLAAGFGAGFLAAVLAAAFLTCGLLATGFFGVALPGAALADPPFLAAGLPTTTFLGTALPLAAGFTAAFLAAGLLADVLADTGFLATGLVFFMLASLPLAADLPLAGLARERVEVFFAISLYRCDPAARCYSL